MITAVEAQRASAQWRKDGGEFIPHPRTWLHQGRWKDEGVAGRAARGSGSTPAAALVGRGTDRSAYDAGIEYGEGGKP